MDRNKLILLFGVFLAGICLVSAEVSVDTVSVIPAQPDTTDTLVCEFTVTGNQSTYSASVTWFANGVAWTSDDETLTVSNGTKVTTGSAGSIEPVDTKKGDVWTCAVTAKDSLDNEDTAQADSDAIVNSVPVVTSSSATKTARVGVQFRFTVAATDADGDALSYSLTTRPTGMDIDSDTGLITWTPEEDQTGSQTVTVRVSDGEAAVTQTFTVGTSALRLEVSDISAVCSPACDDDSLSSDVLGGSAGRIRDVEPGSSLTLRFRVTNTWPSDTEDHDIEDIELECVLEDIADEDEQEEVIDFGDLRPGRRSSREEMTFDIPFEADEKRYNIDCVLTGDDEDGTTYRLDFTVEADVVKERNSVVFTSTAISPGLVSCNRDFQITYEIKNIGSRNERNVQVTISNSELDIYRNEVIPTLDSGDYDDDDTEFRRTASFSIDRDIRAGTYPIILEVLFDGTRLSNLDSVELTVANCVTTAPPEEEEEEEEDVVIVTPPTLPPTQQPGPDTGKPTTVITEEVAFTDSIWWIALLALLALLLLAMLVVLLVVLIKK